MFVYERVVYRMSRRGNVDIIADSDGRKIVVIRDIRFKGKRKINWEDVKAYLRTYVGEFYRIISDDEIIYIGNDLPNEYTGSKYTYKLKGTVAKAKANATQGLPELLKIAQGGNYRENSEQKHNRNAKFGWYRYDSYFALPIYGEKNEVERYNIFHASMIIRHSEDGKKYLYDIVDIKKETGNPLES